MENGKPTNGGNEILITCLKCNHKYTPLSSELKTGVCVCPSCGKERNYESEYKIVTTNINDDFLSTGGKVISFCFPIVGAVIYFYNNNEKPLKAKEACNAALWGMGISFLLSVLSRLF